MSKFLFLFSILFLWAPLAVAEALVLDLKSAVETALSKNPAFKQIQAASEIAAWDQKIAVAGYLPQVTAGFTADRAYRHSGSFYGGENYSLDLRLRQSLIDFSQIAGIKAASLGESYQRHYQKSYQQRIIFDVVGYFYFCLLDQEKLKIRKQALTLAQDELAIAQLRYEEGLVSYYDYLRSDTKALTAKANLNQAEAAYRKSLNELKNILGYNPQENIYLDGDFSFEFSEVNPGLLVEKALDSHPHLAAADYFIGQKKQSLASSRADFLPRIDLEAVQSAANYQGSSKDNSGSFGWYDHWRAYLRVSLPLFEGSGRYWKVKKSQQEVEIAELKKEELLSQIKKNIDSFYQDYSFSRQLVLSQEKNLEKSKELYEIVLKRYKLGEASEIELLDAHLNLIDVESAYKEARCQAIISYYGMLLASGQLDVVKFKK